jgi:folate-dependent phosphoribosylglycinamide formyltransferase PurN
VLGEGANDGYEIVAVVASDPASNALIHTTGTGVPCLVHDIRSLYRHRGRRLTDLTIRADYDAATASMLHDFHPDLVLACGYLHILTAPMLAAFPDRIISVHDADLRIVGSDGHPRYPGLHATLDSLRAGERETRSTVHIVREQVDTGPALLVSHPFAVHEVLVADARRRNAIDVLKAYAYAQREWMMNESWGSLLTAALSLFADDAVEVLGSTAWVRGVPGPLAVHQHEEAPHRATAHFRVRP